MNCEYCGKEIKNSYSLVLDIFSIPMKFCCVEHLNLFVTKHSSLVYIDSAGHIDRDLSAHCDMEAFDLGDF